MVEPCCLGFIGLLCQRGSLGRRLQQRAQRPSVILGRIIHGATCFQAAAARRRCSICGGAATACPRGIECRWAAGAAGGCGAQGLDFFGGPPLKADAALRAAEWEDGQREDRVVVLSDVWLDRPDTMDKLCLLLAGAPLHHHGLHIT